MTELARRVGAERGQTLVFFVVILSGLVVLLAFVIDVGAWLGTKHKLQNVADSAALAMVQTGQVSPAIYGSTQLEPDPSTLGQLTPPPTSFQFTAKASAPIILAGVAGIRDFIETATATAQAMPASTLANPPLPNAPYVTPIVVNKCIFTGTCLGSVALSDCFVGGCRLNFDVDDRANSLFGIANITGATPRPNTFRRWMMCNGCAQGPLSANLTALPLTTGTSGMQALNGMNATTGKTLIFPVFDGFDGAKYQIVGFSAFVVTTTAFDSTNWQAQPPGASCKPDCKVITGRFTTYTLPTRLTSSRDSVGLTDFGVRAIGLTS